MIRLIASLSLLIASTLYAMADTSALDGLYYPKGEAPPASCERIEQELHPGGMIIEEGSIYRGESVCKLTQPRQTNNGFEYIMECEAEGEPYRELLTAQQTSNGATLSTREETSDWVQCLKSTGDAKNSQNWSVQKYSDGTIERTISNSNEDQILFSCTNGIEGSILVMLSSQEFFGGSLEFNIDGKQSSLMTWADSIEINTECNVCADHYYSLMEDIRSGRTMVVKADNGPQISFDIAGASKIFDDEICNPKGW